MNVEHPTPNIERPILMTLRFIKVSFSIRLTAFQARGGADT